MVGGSKFKMYGTWPGSMIFVAGTDTKVPPMSKLNALFVCNRHALSAAETSGTCAASSTAASAAASAMSVVGALVGALVGARVCSASTLPWRFFCNAAAMLWSISSIACLLDQCDYCNVHCKCAGRAYWWRAVYML